MKITLGIGVGFAVGFLSTAAFAQGAGGSVAIGASGSAQLPAAPAAPMSPPVSVAQGSPPIVAEEGGTDHDRFIGRWGVGYFGLSSLTIGSAPGANVSLALPIIGARYWLNGRFGIDAGLGFGMRSGSSDTVNGGTTTTVDSPGGFGVGLHGGVPIALAQGKHYTFEVVPELNVLFGAGTAKTANQPDQNMSAIRMQLGGRIGSEIHFGFIGVPELALQASVGLYFDHTGAKTSQSTPNGDTSNSVSSNTFGTSVQSDPWAIFTNNISALYYF